MNPDHVHFAEWDAAYVLGALSPSDRREFEAHLESCDRCRSAIAEIAPTMGLLARIEPAHADSILEGADADGPAHDADLKAKVALAALTERAARRRRRRWISAYAAAAVIIVAIAISVSFAVTSGARVGQVVALESVADVPIEASVELTQVGWGTKLDLKCSYLDGDDEGSAASWPYGLFVTAVDGTTSEVSSWRATVGKTARLSAGTALDVADIAAIEIRALGSGTVLMRTDLEPIG